MAETWARGPLRLFALSNSFISLVERRVPEGASQTFVTHSPLKIVSGLAVEWTAGTDVAFWSAGDGQNVASGAFAMVYFATPELGIEANFLGSAAAANVLAAADFGTAFDLAKGTDLLGTGKDGWYISDTTSSIMVRICEIHSEMTIPNKLPAPPAVGDTDARVRALPLTSLLHWDA
jgi:hypothetical protein